MSTALVTSTQKKVSATLIKQATLFSQLPPALLEKLQQSFHIVDWQKGQYVNAKLLTQQFFILLTGQVEFKQVNPDTAREASVEMFYTGDSFDIMVLLDGQPHDLIISPLANSRLLSVPINTMRQWIWTYPELNNQFLPYLAQKIRDKEQQATDLILYDTSTRLSRLILKHINKAANYNGAKNCAHCDHLVNGLNDETLARMIGSVRQIVNKQLRHWQAQGILEKKRNQLIIHDLEALKREAHLAYKFLPAE